MGRILGCCAAHTGAAWAIVVACVAVGCGSDAPKAGADAGGGDTSIAADAGASDAGPADAGGADAAGTGDAGTDAGGRAGCEGGCEDNNPCTDDTCIAGKCAHSFNAKPCDDGAACTAEDACKDGKCQGKSLRWERNFGGSDEDLGNKALVIDDGDIAVAGSTRSKGAGGRDAWIVRIDRFGEQVWEQFLGNEHDQAAYDIGRHGQRLTVVGAWRDKAKGAPRGFVHQLDMAGKAVSTKLLKAEQFGEINAISVGAAATKPTLRMHVAGHREDKAGNISLAVANLEPDTLQLLWIRHLGATGFDAAWGIVQLYSGDLGVVGDTAPGGSGPHVWLQQLAADGKANWGHTYHGTGQDTGWALIGHPDPVNQNKGFTVAGSRKAKGDKVNAVWLMRTDAAGKSTWQVSIPAKAGATAFDLARADGGGYVLAGRAAEVQGQERATMWSVDKVGTVKWKLQAGQHGSVGRGALRWTDAVGLVGATAAGKAADLLVVRASKTGKLSCP